MTRLFGMFGMLASALVLAGIVAAVAGVILLATHGGQNTFVAVLPSIPGLLLAGTGLAVVGAVLSVIASPLEFRRYAAPARGDHGGAGGHHRLRTRLAEDQWDRMRKAERKLIRSPEGLFRPRFARGCAVAYPDGLMGFSKQSPMRMRSAIIIVVALATLVCLGDLARPAMVFASGQECSGPACEDQIACGQPARPQVPSSFSIDSIYVVGIPAAVAADIPVVHGAPVATGPPPIIRGRQSLPPSAPRSPPAA